MNSNNDPQAQANKTTSEPKQSGFPPQAITPAESSSAEPSSPQQDSAATSGFESSFPGIHIVAIGASAGGLDAFKRFFGAMPKNSGAAFVLLPHLDPNHESLMTELIARQAVMPVQEAKDGMEVLANQVYVIPHNQYLTISLGKLRLKTLKDAGGPPTSIDLFFRSLAIDRGEKSIGIIFSGTGAHGSLGLKEIKAFGGMVMAQDPNTAEFPRMPQSAIATGLVDYILAPEKMPEAIIKYLINHEIHKSGHLELSPETYPHLDQILDLIRNRIRFDFRYYRKPMMIRRIERRMSLGNFIQISDYLEHLKTNPDELKHLYQDFLISVTSFFRDADAFEALGTEVVGPMVKSRGLDDPIRIWSIGCATGEESYSLGILFLEHLAAIHKSGTINIFATDVDDRALEEARQGNYPETISTDVSSDRLARYFIAKGDGSFQVNKLLRERVTFARQNLISDAPFSKLDLIVCRNVLIYLEPEIQEKVIALLHYALKEGGYLFLGPSETVGKQVDLFESISKKWRIFRRIGVTRAEQLKIPIAGKSEVVPHSIKPNGLAPKPRINLTEIARRLLLDQFAPPSILIDRKYKVLYFFGNTGRYLVHPDGPPTTDLMALAKEGLRPKIRSALHQAIEQKGPVVLVDAPRDNNGKEKSVIITIRPVLKGLDPDGLFLITFQDSDQELPPAKIPLLPDEESLVGQLEKELNATREDLQSTIEDLEGSNEEIKVAHEEAMSMNEELQSANEELETSKEELQSLNEELATVNSQLQEKVNDLETANNDMANLLNSSEVGIIFLDTQFRIRRYTPPATKLFNLIASDIGRPISDITPRFFDNTLKKNVEYVLQALTPHEKQIRGRDGKWWSQKVTLYRTLDNHIEGTVITFTDLTQVKRSEDTDRRLGAVLLDSNDAVYIQDFEGKITTWNFGAERMTGYPASEALNMNILQMIPQEYRAKSQSDWVRLSQNQSVDSWDSQRVTRDGRILDVLVTATVLKDETGHPIGIVKTERDITEKIRAQKALRKSQEQLGAILQTAADAILSMNGQGVILSVNQATERMFGYPATELVGRLIQKLLPILGEETGPLAMGSFAGDGLKVSVGARRELKGQRKDGTEFPVELSASKVDGLEIFTAILRDITDRNQAEATLRESERFARATLDGLSAQVAILSQNGTILAYNKAWMSYAKMTLAGSGKEGENFLGACENAPGPYYGKGKQVAKGIRSVLSGELPEFVTEYAWDGPEKKRWYTVRVTPFPGEGLRRVVIAHEDITLRKELEREVVEIALLEQRRIGQDLHDCVGQELTALNLLAGDLSYCYQTNPANTKLLIERMVQGLKRSQQELRSVLHGLLPVAVDSEGLMAALSDMADRVEHEGKIHCRFDCPRPVTVSDNLTATQIFLIGQEAVQNAIKHSHGKNIVISMESNGHFQLRVRDDGIGMAGHMANRPHGLGIRIMENRANIIGADLTIGTTIPSGTLVNLILAGKEHGPGDRK